MAGPITVSLQLYASMHVAFSALQKQRSISHGPGTPGNIYGFDTYEAEPDESFSFELSHAVERRPAIRTSKASAAA